MSTTEARGRNATGPVRSIFAGLMKCQHCDGTVTRVNKGDHVYLVCSAAHAKAGTHPYESVPYDQAVSTFKANLRKTLDTAPRGNDTADIDAEIEQLKVEIDAGEDAVNELLEMAISDKSTTARDRLLQYEQELEAVRDDLRSAVERREMLTGANVEKRLAAVEQALSAEPMNTEEANKALRGAVSKMVMRPQEGRLNIRWHHAEQIQETVFLTSRFDWDANQMEDEKQEQQ
ncbi:zinc ribbon domain-containing protein [Bradyrhizobium sp. 147]|uniref:zinc ribbon domain-containing protein n=1 Tax=Bradyrhizobium sp. 147 TaxID=2782623 RepID=UPI001FFA64DD|nr:zinc ribbon domain-containing protein [Bradyrhizobium sp. 147]MCK1678520.1 zinc ribbon domain-containing protein [Bradyrhizobium sp. 147]